MTLLDLVWLVGSLLAVVTKYLDCRTTATKIAEHGGHGGEQNPRARALMDRFGAEPVLWGTFAALVASLVLSTLLWPWARSLPVIPYLALAGVWALALTQGAVAHTNHTGRLNVFTWLLARLYRLR